MQVTAILYHCACVLSNTAEWHIKYKIDTIFSLFVKRRRGSRKVKKAKEGENSPSSLELMQSAKDTAVAGR